MWRFMLLTFAFLGWSFYELSGGADYAPAPESLQVAMQTKPFFAVPKPLPKRTQYAAADDASGKPALTSRLAQQQRDAIKARRDARKRAKEERYKQAVAESRYRVTLASGGGGIWGDDPNALEDMRITGVGDFSAETLIKDTAGLAVTDLTAEPGEGAIELAAADIAGTTIQSDVYRSPLDRGDFRSVTGSLVNMRDGPGTDYLAVDKLSQGTVVEVIETAENGWLHLRVTETGQTGWMADWLVTGAQF